MSVFEVAGSYLSYIWSLFDLPILNTGYTYKEATLSVIVFVFVFTCVRRFLNSVSLKSKGGINE